MIRAGAERTSITAAVQIAGVFVAAAALLFPSATQAHNGSAAFALPLADITIDGDLSDWPDDLPTYPIRENSDPRGLTDLTGTDLNTSADFSPEFMVGYSLKDQFIYVALRVRDDETQVGSGYGLTDACEVHVDPGHGRVPYQYVLSPEGGSYLPDGTNPVVHYGASWWMQIDASRSHGAVARVGDITVYEWALELSFGGPLEFRGTLAQAPLTLAAGMSLGFDVVAVDKDNDGDPADRISWGPLPRKSTPERLGDLTLIPNTGHLGTARGTVVGPAGEPYGGVVLLATASGRTAGSARTDTQGHFDMRLPAGDYTLIPARAEGVAYFETETVVNTGAETHVDLSVTPTPFLARLSLWADPSRMAELETSYETVVAPLLRDVGWEASSQPGRATVDSVLSRLFEVRSTYDAQAKHRALWGPGDSDLREALRRLGTEFGTSRSDGRIRGEFRIYATPKGRVPIRIGSGLNRERPGFPDLPEGMGRTVAAGPGATTVARGQSREAGTGSRQQGWRVFGSRDGLPRSTIVTMLQDNAGNLWLGSEAGGAVRYDGLRFTTYTTDDGLADNRILAMAEDSRGNLWFGTRRGLSRFDGTAFITYTVGDGLPDSTVTAIAVDDDDGLWLGSESAGVSHFDGRTFTTFSAEDGLGENWVSSIVVDRWGGVWTGGNHAASRFDGQRFTTYSSADVLAGEWVTALSEDRQENVWISTNEGSSRFDGQQFTTFAAEDGVPQWSGPLAEDTQGELWIIGGDLLYRLGGGSPRRIGDTVISVLATRDGYVWASGPGGVSRYEESRLETFTTEDGLTNNKVICLLEDRQGRIWAGCERGVSRYENGQLRPLDIHPVLDNNEVRSMLEDRRGNIWFATYAGGVCRYDGNTATLFTSRDGLAADWTQCIAEDSQGILWFGHAGGVSRYDEQRFTTFNTGDGLAGGWVWSVLEYLPGDLWFGLRQAGISRFDGERFTTLTTADGLTSNDVRPLMKDRQGDLWIGTSDAGAIRYDGQRFHGALTIEDGLAFNSLRAILEDSAGHFWFGTYGSGISRYDGDVFRHMGRRDGLPHDRIYDIIEDGKGDVWIATRGGLARYHPSRTPPVVSLTQAIADKRYGPVSEISIPTSQPFVIFEFRAPSLDVAWSGMTYRYRLEGIDEEWRTTQEERVEYPGLPRGDYRFQVEAIDRDLNRSEQPATVSVHVHFAYRQIAISAGIGLGVLMIALQAGRLVQRDRRVRQANLALSATNQQLQEKSADLEEANRSLRSTQSQLVQAEKMATVGLLAGGVAHEINNPLQILLDGARRILRFPEDVQRHQQSAGLMEQAAQRCSSVVQNLLNYTRKSSDDAEDVDLDEVVRSTLALLQHNLQQTDIQLQVEEGDPLVLTGNFNELCTVVTNLVMNARDATLAMKQEDGRTPAIEIATSSTGEGYALLTVKDNGGGIPEDARERIFDPFYTTKEAGAGTGLGLSIVQGIVERHGGEIELTSSAEGAAFTVRLPLNPEG